MDTGAGRMSRTTRPSARHSMPKYEESNVTDEEDLATLRQHYADWGVAKEELSKIESDIAVLENRMGYTEYVGGPHLMQRRA